MGDRFMQSTSKHSKVKAQATVRKKFRASTPYERQSVKSETNCGYENIPSENNTDVLSLLKTIIKNQESLEKRIEQIENSVFNTESVILKDIIQRNQAMVPNKKTRVCKVMVKRSHLGGRMTEKIEDVTSFDEIASTFPLVTMDALIELEEKLNVKNYNKSMLSYIGNLKDFCNSVDGVLRQLFTDTLMQNFNWDGRWGKKPLNALKIINQILFETFQADAETFEPSVKRYVELSRNRIKQKIRVRTKNKKKQELLGYP